MKKQLSMLAILVSASLSAQAAQDPFFTINDVSDKGYASGISADGSGLIGINTKNNMSEFFSTVRFADFLVDRFRFESGCMLSGDVCDTFWDEEPGFAYQWRRDLLDDVDQRSNVGVATSSETDGLITALGDIPENRVGYKMEGNLRTAFAIVGDGAPVALKDGASTHSLSVPTSIRKLDDGRYLVTGTAATGKNHVVNGDFYNYCFAGDDDDYDDYRYCPGVDTQASFWILNTDGTSQLMQAAEYGFGRNDVLQTASALAAGKYADTLYGVGYSSTGEVGSGDLDGRNLASYWTLDLSSGSGTLGKTQLIPLPDGRPGEEIDDSERLQHSWAVGISSNGYVVGNQRWNVSKGQNRPVELFVYNLKSPASNAIIPLQDSPLKGSGSEAMAINDHDMVVGWRDSRHQTQPVVDGTNRMQEALLLDAAAPNNNWYINDLICGLDDAGAKLCQQNGKYYHIAYASGISTDGTVAATAYRYDSESDLHNRINATVVAVTLTPAVKDYKGNEPAAYKVENAPVANQTGQDGDGGGGSLFWLTLLALPFAWLRRRQG